MGREEGVGWWKGVRIAWAENEEFSGDTAVWELMRGLVTIISYELAKFSYLN
jgi:hypothetical protein